MAPPLWVSLGLLNGPLVQIVDHKGDSASVTLRTYSRMGGILWVGQHTKHVLLPACGKTQLLSYLCLRKDLNEGHLARSRGSWSVSQDNLGPHTTQMGCSWNPGKRDQDQLLSNPHAQDCLSPSTNNKKPWSPGVSHGGAEKAHPEDFVLKASVILSTVSFFPTPPATDTSQADSSLIPRPWGKSANYSVQFQINQYPSY